MSKAISYYDWELSFRKSPTTANNLTNKKPKNINSIGLSEGEFKDFMTNWRKKNLSS
ncbi:unnamed protein product [marine sediment metagenome]|uniref:Uncharacterized protein n=1 Tax=marine sediment metagenome TaxID=412755 RepID=X1AZ44_9ZZZZ